MNERFAPKLRIKLSGNGTERENITGFISDRTNRLIGWVILRQLRVKSEPCQKESNATLKAICFGDFHDENEDRDSFLPGWISIKGSQFDGKHFPKAFQYQSGDKSQTGSYAGELTRYPAGGYIVELRGSLKSVRNNLTQLQQSQWIDQQTRIVLIEMSLYTPNLRLFTPVTIAMEFSATGLLIGRARFEPMSLTSSSFSFLFSRSIRLKNLLSLFRFFFNILSDHRSHLHHHHHIGCNRRNSTDEKIQIFIFLSVLVVHRLWNHRMFMGSSQFLPEKIF